MHSYWHPLTPHTCISSPGIAAVTAIFGKSHGRSRKLIGISYGAVRRRQLPHLHTTAGVALGVGSAQLRQRLSRRLFRVAAVEGACAAAVQR
jgi:hypothetical protein